MTHKKLTRQQKAFADYLLEHPKENLTKAVMATYDVENPRTASGMAGELLRKPHVQAYLDIHSQKAQDTVLEVMDVSKDYAKGGGKEGAAYAAVAVNAAKDIMDRVHGKATQKIEQQTTAVNINIDLTSATGD